MVGRFAHIFDCMDAPALGKGAGELTAKYPAMEVELGHEEVGSQQSSQRG